MGSPIKGRYKVIVASMYVPLVFVVATSQKLNIHLQPRIRDVVLRHSVSRSLNTDHARSGRQRYCSFRHQRCSEYHVGTWPVSRAEFDLALTYPGILQGLAPTLIIVRVAYGKSIDSVEQITQIHFAEKESQSGSGYGTSAQLQATVDIRHHPPSDDGLGSSVDTTKPEGKIDQMPLV